MEEQEENKPRMVLLQQSTFNMIVNYLATQPYKNVSNIIELLKEAKLVKEEVEAPTLVSVEGEKKVDPTKKASVKK